MRAGPECPRFFCNSFHREIAHRSAWHSRLARVWDTSIESQRGSDGALDHSSTRTIQYTLDSRVMSQHKTDNTTDTDTPTWAALLKRYQSLVGALLYVTVNTRPDVAYSVGMLCRAMSCPTAETMAGAERVLHYLHRHRHVGLRYTPDQGDLRGMTDSDWATKHSISGFVFTYSSAAVSWGSKKQTSIALSSTEAEIMAASEGAKEAIYLSRFFDELGAPVSGPVEMAVDNQSAIAVSYNPEHHARVKHIDRRHFYVREAVEEGLIRVPYVATADNMADLFTKPLPARIFFPMRDRIMNHMPLRPEGSGHGGPLKSTERATAPEPDTAHPPSGIAHEVPATNTTDYSLRNAHAVNTDCEVTSS